MIQLQEVIVAADSANDDGYITMEGMGLFLRQDEHRSELQQRVAAELQEKLKNDPNLTYDKPEPAILDNQHETRIAGKVMLFLILALIVAIIIFALRAGGLI